MHVLAFVTHPYIDLLCVPAQPFMASVVNRERRVPYFFFFDQSLRLLFFAAGFRGARTRVVLVRLLFKGDVYFLGETADSNDG